MNFADTQYYLLTRLPELPQEFDRRTELMILILEDYVPLDEARASDKMGKRIGKC